MASRGRDEGGYYSNEVVVHIARVTKGVCTGGHNGRDLKRLASAAGMGVQQSNVPADWFAGKMAPARGVDLRLFSKVLRCPTLPAFYLSILDPPTIHCCFAYHRVRVLRQPPHGQQTIVRIHHHASP